MKDELRNNTWTLQQRIVPISLNVAWLDLIQGKHEIKVKVT
jgi:hypothetical protein